MKQWAQKPDKTCEFYPRVVNNTYISFSDGKNSLLHRQLTICTSIPQELEQIMTFYRAVFFIHPVMAIWEVYSLQGTL
jgi:hypothetical protein